MDMLYENESLKLLKCVYNIQQKQSHLEKKINEFMSQGQLEVPVTS